jgi:hypothetical protein
MAFLVAILAFFSYYFSLGFGVRNVRYTAFSYEYAEALLPKGEAYRALSWFNTYAFSTNFFLTFNYARGLDESSYNHTVSLKLGVNVE